MAIKNDNVAPVLHRVENIRGLFGLSEENTKEIQTFYDIEFNPKLIIEETITYPNHPFRLYTGERLEDMVESIKAHGVMQPIIVRKKNNGYEILSGHNRVHAARIAGLTNVPATIMLRLTDEEAHAYVIETNLMQRSFSDMSHSEKAAVIALHHSKMFSQGKRNDIQMQLKLIEESSNGGQKITSSQVAKKSTSIEIIGMEYGLSKDTISRYLRINKLVCTLKEKVDKGIIPFVPAVTISFLLESEQKILNKCIELNKFKVDMKKAELLRLYSKDKSLNDDNIYKILSGEIKDNDKQKSKRPNRTPSIGRSIFRKYFTASQTEKEVQSIIEEALELYYAQKMS